MATTRAAEIWLWSQDFDLVEEASYHHMISFPALRNLAVDTYCDPSSGTVLFCLCFDSDDHLRRSALASWAKYTGMSFAEPLTWSEDRRESFMLELEPFLSEGQESILARGAELLGSRLKWHAQYALEQEQRAPSEILASTGQQQRRRFAHGTIQPHPAPLESLAIASALAPSLELDDAALDDEPFDLDDLDIPIYEDDGMELIIDFVAD